MILLTHSHWDHIARGGSFKEKLNVPVYVHREDAGNFRSPGRTSFPLFSCAGGQARWVSDGWADFDCGEPADRGDPYAGPYARRGLFLLSRRKGAFFGGYPLSGDDRKFKFSDRPPPPDVGFAEKIGALPPDTKVYPGHGGPTTIGAEKWIANAQAKFLTGRFYEQLFSWERPPRILRPKPL